MFDRTGDIKLQKIGCMQKQILNKIQNYEKHTSFTSLFFIFTKTENTY